MTDQDANRPDRSLTPETLASVAAIRGIPVDDALLEELQPMVSDMFDLVDGIEQWLEQQAPAAPAAPAGGGPRA